MKDTKILTIARRTKSGNLSTQKVKLRFDNFDYDKLDPFKNGTWKKPFKSEALTTLLKN